MEITWQVVKHIGKERLLLGVINGLGWSPVWLSMRKVCLWYIY